MTDYSITATSDHGPLPPDDLGRQLVLASAGDQRLPRISLAGNTYTILISGKDTQGRYCLIDMLVPDGGGPPPHRHDFEELFTLLEGELEFTFRGETTTVKAPAHVNIPANAPHQFRNISGRAAHMLCMCTPAGQDEFFLSVGTLITDGGDQPSAEPRKPGPPSPEILAKYRTEMLGKP